MERERQNSEEDSALSVGPSVGLDLMTLRSRPELKPGGSLSTDCSPLPRHLNNILRCSTHDSVNMEQVLFSQVL